MQKELPQSVQLSIFDRHPTNYQSNLFTESRQEFTELEKKIVTLVVNQIGNMAVQGQIQPNYNQVVTIPYSELTKARYDQITEAAESLWKKCIRYKDEKTGEFEVGITPFPIVQIITNNGRKSLRITMLADVVPHFAALGQRYTKYDLDVMLSLSSVYAQRMFEIVSMNYHIKKMRFVYPVDELRSILNCPDTYRYADFKVNVLDVAQRELRDKANILLEWQPYKKVGKRIVELEFTIKTGQQIAYEGVKEAQEILSTMPTHEIILLAWKVMAGYSLKPWQKELVASDPVLWEILFKVHAEFENGARPAVKNRTAYLVKSLGLEKSKPAKAVVKATPDQQQLTLISPSNIPKTSPAPVAASSGRIGATQPLGSIAFNIIERIQSESNQ